MGSRTGGPEAPLWLVLLVFGAGLLLTALAARDATIGVAHLAWIVPTGLTSVGLGSAMLAGRVGEWTRAEDELPSAAWGLGLGALAVGLGYLILRATAALGGGSGASPGGWSSRAG